MKKCIAFLSARLVSIAFTTAAVAEDSVSSPRPRGFMIEAQLGPAYTSYDAATDQSLSLLKSCGVTRVRIDLAWK